MAEAAEATIRAEDRVALRTKLSFAMGGAAEGASTWAFNGFVHGGATALFGAGAARTMASPAATATRRAIAGGPAPRRSVGSRATGSSLTRVPPTAASQAASGRPRRQAATAHTARATAGTSMWPPLADSRSRSM